MKAFKAALASEIADMRDEVECFMRWTMMMGKSESFTSNAKTDRTQLTLFCFPFFFFFLSWDHQHAKVVWDLVPI
jgi:hypothetical protein